MNRQSVSILLGIGAIAAAGWLVGCSTNGSGDLEKAERMTGKTIEQVLRERTDEWMSIPGVEGTGIGISKGNPCIRIFTSSKPQELRTRIPSNVEGYPVIIEETGTFRALNQQ